VTRASRAVAARASRAVLARASRAVLALAGLAALAWGAVLAVQVAAASARNGISAVAWVIGPPVVHDAVIAPVVGVVGLLLARTLPGPWRVPVTAAAAVSGVLALIAVPSLWRTFGGSVNPGLHDRNYAAGLLLWLGVLWVVALVAGIVRTWRAKRTPVSTPMAAAPVAREADNDEGPHTDR
jgi:hypothetical protein